MQKTQTRTLKISYTKPALKINSFTLSSNWPFFFSVSQIKPTPPMKNNRRLPQQNSIANVLNL